MEFTSELIWRWANEYLKDKDMGRTCCWKTESKENKSNKASYEEIPDWFKSQIKVVKLKVTQNSLIQIFNQQLSLHYPDKY